VEEAQPYLFLPLWQNARLAATAHVRSGTRDAAALIPEIRRAVGDTRAGLPVFDEGLLSDKVAIGSMPTRLAASWLAGFGALATFLAVIGLSGVLGHAVSLRRREIGVRMALGADRRTIEGMFVRQGLRMVLVGLCFGLAGAFAVTRLMASLLYGVSATDPLTFAATALLVGGVALAATYLPARRAARLDPIQVLRAD
jgi:predicted lysophospholipase L1 biosynthesis ABC-type transport system permease subunit